MSVYLYLCHKHLELPYAMQIRLQIVPQLHNILLIVVDKENASWCLLQRHKADCRPSCN